MRCTCTALFGLALTAFTVPAQAAASFIEPSSLRLEAGDTLKLRLELPTGESWAEANVPQLQLRAFGRSGSLPLPDDPKSKVLSVGLDEPGRAVLVLSAGPASAKGLRDSIQRTPYCAKVLLRVDAAGEPGKPLRSPDMTAKTGQLVEIRPYVDPTAVRLAPGETTTMPVRAYFEGQAQAHVKVSAHAPDGVRFVATTDANGWAIFQLGQAGRWLVRHEHVTRSGVFTGDLLFEIEAAGSTR